MLTRVNMQNDGTVEVDDNPAYENDVRMTGLWQRDGLAYDDVMCCMRQTPRRKPEKHAKQRYENAYISFSSEQKDGFEIVFKQLIYTATQMRRFF